MAQVRSDNGDGDLFAGRIFTTFDHFDPSGNPDMGNPGNGHQSLRHDCGLLPGSQRYVSRFPAGLLNYNSAGKIAVIPGVGSLWCGRLRSSNHPVSVKALCCHFL